MPVYANRFLASLVLILLLASATAAEQAHSYEGWPVYRGGPDALQYSSLQQINRSNVDQLEVAWVYHSGDAEGNSTIQCNPILYQGKLYVTTPQLDVVALKADSGEEIWRYQPGAGNTIAGVNRGVTLWQYPDEARILFTAGHELIALDAESGQLINSFGRKGKVDLREHLGYPVEQLSLSVTSPGIIRADLIILGSSTGEGYQASPGHVRAYDVRSGELAWIFHTIPQRGQRGADTWQWVEGEWYGGANVWGGLSLDVERGWVFLATGSPTYDFYGANRLGKNDYGNSVVALDASTGRYIWHYQVIHHDLWDYDLSSAPSLVTLTIDGQPRDVVVQPTKMGFVLVLDRETGESLYPMDSIPVPPSDIIGEYAWPTQPMPSTGFFTRQFLNESDLRTFSTGTGEDAFAEYRKYRYWGRYTPPSLQGSLAFPGTWGGGLWGGASIDPESGTLFINANEIASINQLRPVQSREQTAIMDDQPDSPAALIAAGRSLYEMNCALCHGIDMAGIPPAFPSLLGVGERLTAAEIRSLIHDGKGAMPGFTQFDEIGMEGLTAYITTDTEPATETVAPMDTNTRFVLAGYWKFIDQKGYPFSAPPWGSLNALDLATGKLKWRVPLGEIAELTRRGIPITGDRNFGGCISTAGGLVFIAATTDEKIRAFDAETGAEVWSAKLPAAGFAVPATYMLNGRQYLVIACGGGGRGGTPAGDAFVAFALPEK